MNDDRIIEIEVIENMLKTQFFNVIQNDKFYYQNVNVEIANEQKFIKQKNRNPNTIYIVFKLSTFTLDYGQVIMPITLTAVSEFNALNKCQRLLLDFSQLSNLQWSEDQTIRQFWDAPQDVSNFEEVYDGFRSVFYVSGALAISKNANFCELYYLNSKGEWEDINYLTFAESTDIQVDSQVFQTTKNFVKSIGMSGLNTLSLTTYLLDEEFCNKCLAIKIKDLERQPDGVDTKFYFKFKFKNGYELIDVYKMVSFAMNIQLREIPVANMSFIN